MKINSSLSTTDNIFIAPGFGELFKDNPHVFFSTSDSVLNALQTASLEASPETFNTFFLVTTRVLITNPASDPSVSHQFQPVTLSNLADVVSKSNPSGSPRDAVPPHLFKKIFPSIGQLVLKIIIASLFSFFVCSYEL